MTLRKGHKVFSLKGLLTGRPGAKTHRGGKRLSEEGSGKSHRQVTRTYEAGKGSAG